MYLTTFLYDSDYAEYTDKKANSLETEASIYGTAQM